MSLTAHESYELYESYRINSSSEGSVTKTLELQSFPVASGPLGKDRYKS